MENKLIIATSQFPVSTDLEKNFNYIVKHTVIAKKRGAHIVHFPELALSGYESNVTSINWDLIDGKVCSLSQLAKDNDINIVVGVHKKNGVSLPYNTTLLLLKDGKVGGEYIKSKLYGKEVEKFSCKDNFFACDIEGFICGFLICYDSNFPNLFIEYRNKNVKLLFLSFYNARSSKPKNSMDELMKSQFVTRATDNLFYISGSNSSEKYSRMPSSFVCPDGTLTQLTRHKPGILISEFPKADLGWVCDNRI